jgi:hypothetical protein
MWLVGESKIAWGGAIFFAGLFCFSHWFLGRWERLYLIHCIGKGLSLLGLVGSLGYMIYAVVTA